MTYATGAHPCKRCGKATHYASLLDAFGLCTFCATAVAKEVKEYGPLLEEDVRALIETHEAFHRWLADHGRE